MKLQNPDKETLRESFSEESSEVALDSGDFGMDGLKCDGKFPVRDVLMEEEDEGGDKVRKIEVSGGNISLVVDFSGSLSGISSHNVFESDGCCQNENLVKGNVYREDETQEFLVGNLVWVMTKNRKWWPGEVVDFKADAKESFMVRYIGQSHHVSWFAPSKLKPFKESFEQVLNQGNNNGFFAAVEKAMTLLSNSLKLDMTCSCIADGNGIVSAQNVMTRKNKPLILREFSIDRLEPKEFVTQLKNTAKCVLDAGILETTVVQSRLSAFYTFFGHKQIPMDQLYQNEGRKSFTGKMNDSQFIGSPSIVAGNSRMRFRKEWFRKFISEVDSVSARDDLVNVPPSDLISKLKLFAVDYNCSEETENIGLTEWFFSKFRMSVFHDENAYKMQLANMAGFKDLMLAKHANCGTEQKTLASKKSGKSIIESSSCVPVADTEQKTLESQKSEKLKIESLNGVSTTDNDHKKSGNTKINHVVGHTRNSGTEQKTLASKKSGKSIIESSSCVPVADTEQKTLESQKSENLKIESLNGVSTTDNDHKKSGNTKINHVVGHTRNSGTEQKTLASKKSGKSIIESSSCVPVADTEQKTLESQKSEKLKIESLNGVSTTDNDHKKSGNTKINHVVGHSGISNSDAKELLVKDVLGKPLVQSPEGKATTIDILSRPAATLVPDLNSGGNALGTAEFDHLQRPGTLMFPNVCPQGEKTPKSMIINFQVTAPSSTYGVSGTQFVSSQPDPVRNFTSADLFTNSGKKKRGRKRKNAEELPRVAHATTGIPDLNGITSEPTLVLPQVEPTQRRRRRKKEELPNGLNRRITILFLKFSSQVSMPSRDDLTSTFSAFGPLDSSETHVSEEFSGAQVAFVSSDDAIEAVKSLEKANPFGETLVSFRLQQKLITVQRNIAPRMPVISHVSPVAKLDDTPTSVDSMRQNLIMMTAMLEKSGDSLSREMKAKLKSEITGLLEKVSSMPSSSSS